MEISKSLHVGVNYKDRSSLLNWEGFRFVEIAVIDKTHPTSHPLLYQLNEEKITREELLHLTKLKSTSLSKENFFLVGKVISIDKNKKQILLTDNNIIAYKLLVIAGGKKQTLFQETELAAALHTLNHTLRVKPKIPSSFLNDTKSTSLTSHKKPAIALKNNASLYTIKVACPHIFEKHDKPFDLDALDSRIYEVHT